MFDENEIIAQVLKGETRAFEKLVEQYEQLVFYVISRLIKDQDDKEDVCQEVFIKVHKNLGTFKFQSKFSTWIGRIAYLTAINYLKAKKISSDYPADLDNFYFSTETPDTLLDKKDSAAYMNKLIGEMPIQYRTVITLYHLNEFSYSEIEEITGMPEGTVKSYLFRARKLLKEKLELHFKNEDL
jgi:RNA polymerase sigma factor (sigma-70 family)